MDDESLVGARPSLSKKKKPHGSLATNTSKIIGGQNRFKDLRERTLTRDNWNYFVGDQEYKTDMFLRLHESNIK